MIFRSLRGTSIKNLLSLQAERVYLETDDEHVAAFNAKCGMSPNQDFPKNWGLLRTNGDDSDNDQWQLFLQLRSKLKEYSPEL